MSTEDQDARRHAAVADLDLGPIDQVSFAVEDISTALSVYEPLFGPFTTRETAPAPDSLVYRGRPVRARLRLAFCRSGEIEIELVQVLSGEWPTLEHIRRHGPGLHHVRFLVDDLEEKRAEMEDSGFATVIQGVSPRGSRFAYLESPAILGPTMVELLQQPPGEGKP